MSSVSKSHPIQIKINSLDIKSYHTTFCHSAYTGSLLTVEYSWEMQKVQPAVNNIHNRYIWALILVGLQNGQQFFNCLSLKTALSLSPILSSMSVGICLYFFSGSSLLLTFWLRGTLWFQFKTVFIKIKVYCFFSDSILMENYHKLHRGSEKLKEYKKGIMHHREILSVLHSQLQQRKKQLFQELLFIYPIDKIDDHKYSILGIYLPNSDKLAGKYLLIYFLK